MIAISAGAASGNRPTGPFDSTAPATHTPEIAPAVSAAVRPRAGRTRTATAAVTNTQTVVSRRFPTIDHDTTGTTIQIRIGNHSWSQRSELSTTSSAST